MKIIDKYKDYYDSAMAYISEPDQDCIYNRKMTIIKEDIISSNLNIPASIESSFRNNSYRFIQPLLILFCGKAYPVIKITYYTDEIDPQTNQYYRDFYAYNLNEYESFMKEKRIDLPEKTPQSAFDSVLGKPKNSIKSKRGARDFFKQKGFDCSKFHHEYQSPIIVFSHQQDVDNLSYKLMNKKQVILNPKLKDYSFAKEVTPTEAFQEIYMYMGGVLSNNPDPTDNIFDEVKRDQKGFNRYSFKTMKGEKKPRRRNKK